MKADLHMHSTCSDGKYTPEELMILARQNGMDTVSLTDHDTISGTERARKTAEILGMRFVSGVEISTGKGGEIHVLGYGLDENDLRLNVFLEKQRISREERIPKMLAKLDELGIHLNRERIFARASGSIGRPHIAAEMVEMEYVRSTEEAFELYLKRGAAAYVPREEVDTAEVISYICEWGGIPVLAHPGLIKENIETVKSSIVKWIDRGLMGLEVFYPAHRACGYEPWLSFAKEHSLIITGGSDFHTDHDKDKDHGSIASVSDDWNSVEKDIDNLILRRNI